jgi:hypothetical protein
MSACLQKPAHVNDLIEIPPWSLYSDGKRDTNFGANRTRAS